MNALGWPHGAGDGWDMLTPDQQQMLLDAEVGAADEDFDIPDLGSSGVRRWLAWLGRKGGGTRPPRYDLPS